MKTLSRKSLRVLLAGALFVILTLIKLLFPNETEPARSAIREFLGRDAEYMTAFRELGDTLSSSGSVTEAFMRLTGQSGSAGETYSPGSLETLKNELTAPLPEGKPSLPKATPEPEPSPTPEPTPEPVPEVVSAFYAQQEQFSAYEVPANVSYSYPELPFDYVSPVAGMTSSGFGYRQHPLKNEVPFHYGTDFAAWTGTEILAFADGTVSFVGWDAGFGNYVIIQHSDGWQTLYAHCSAVYVASGQSVSAGECIGLVGATGNVTGPHLHLELTNSGVYYNPEFFLA